MRVSCGVLAVGALVCIRGAWPAIPGIDAGAFQTYGLAVEKVVTVEPNRLASCGGRAMTWGPSVTQRDVNWGRYIADDEQDALEGGKAVAGHRRVRREKAHP